MEQHHLETKCRPPQFRGLASDPKDRLRASLSAAKGGGVLQLSIPHATTFPAFDQKQNQHRISKCEANGISKCTENSALSKAVFITKSAHWAWLGREGSNLRMAESKSAALPLGYAPTMRAGRFSDRAVPIRFPATSVYRGSHVISTGYRGEFHVKPARRPPPSIMRRSRGWTAPVFTNPRGAAKGRMPAGGRVERTPVS